MNILVPADVPSHAHDQFIRRYSRMTQDTDNLMLFTGDQKIEHLNDDFYGTAIHPDAMSPVHLFQIAGQGEIGAFAAHLGLIARYGKQHAQIPYVVKLNGKTNSHPSSNENPCSSLLWRTADVVAFEKESGLNICGVGLTLYLGSEQESIMLAQAAQEIYHAHQHGYVATVWVYPRGKTINEQDPRFVAGATGLANALGADFVKIKPPHDIESLRLATLAAGNTKVICAGGTLQDATTLLEQIHQQITIGGTAGIAIGRNIFQRSLSDALALKAAISAIVTHKKSAQEAIQLYKTHQKP